VVFLQLDPDDPLLLLLTYFSAANYYYCCYYLRLYNDYPKECVNSDEEAIPIGFFSFGISGEKQAAAAVAVDPVSYSLLLCCYY